MEINGQTIATMLSVLTLISLVVTHLRKRFEFVNHQKEQDKEIKDIREKHEMDQNSTQEELTIIIYGTLACLKGLNEKGCNGPVTDAIKKIETHLNTKAHKRWGA